MKQVLAFDCKLINDRWLNVIKITILKDFKMITEIPLSDKVDHEGAHILNYISNLVFLSKNYLGIVRMCRFQKCNTFHTHDRYLLGIEKFDSELGLNKQTNKLEQCIYG